MNLYITFFLLLLYPFKTALLNYYPDISNEKTHHVTVGSLYINEFMASNKKTSIPGYSGFDDWIEIRNTSSSNIDISGYYITDKLSNPTKRQLPTGAGSVVVPANGYLVLICSGNPGLGANHIDLGLSASGEEIGLFAPDMTLVDSIEFGPQQSDVSMGREPGNLMNWRYFNNPTPGTENDMSDSFEIMLPEPVFSRTGGIYTSNFNLTLSTDVSGATIYYTLDGSEPNPDNLSPKTYHYKNEPNGSYLPDQINTHQFHSGSSISIKNRSSDPNKLSVKSTTYQKKDGVINYYFPTNKVAKGTVVRAIICKSNTCSPVATHTFFVFSSKDRYKYPVVSISIDEDNLFDYSKGIYTPGADGYYNGTPPSPLNGNYNRNTRYLGNFEYLVDGDQILSETVEYRIHGGSSRNHPQKSLNVYGKGNLNYAFFDKFPDRIHKNLILRNGGNNWGGFFVKDAVNHEIMDKLNFGVQETTPTITFMNGEYWGILNLREKLNEHYIKTVYGVSEDNLDIIKVDNSSFEASEGDLDAFNELLGFVKDEDNHLSNSSTYAELLNLIDIESFIDFHIAQVFLGNNDWPQNNTRLWRNRIATFDPNVKGPEDGRWRWLMYDTDSSYGPETNTLKILLENGHDNSRVFREVWNNSTFKEQFRVRFADLLNTNFTSTRVEAIVDAFIDKVDLEVDEHVDRWTQPGNWTSFSSYIKSDYIERVAHQKSIFKSYNSVGSEYSLTVNVSDKDHGYVKVNTIDILSSTPGIAENPYPWTGAYYKNLPTTLTAHGYHGYRFKRWLRNGSNYSSSPTITFNLSSNYTYTAEFESYTLSDNPYPQAKVLDECGYTFNTWSASSGAGTYPPNMSFVYFLKSGSSQSDHLLGDDFGGLYELKYNGDDKSRINGLGSDGIAFINTGSNYDNIPQATLGGAVLALNTTGQDAVFVNWKGGTVLPNSRKYRIRLQYRVGDVVAFSDVLDSNGNVVEYKRNSNAGHSENFENIALPAAALNQPYVQLLWRYYHGGTESSGSRAQMRLDDIQITTSKSYGKSVNQSSVTAAYGKIDSKATIKGTTEYKSAGSIVLSPGFNTEKNVTFKAEVKTCI